MHISVELIHLQRKDIKDYLVDLNNTVSHFRWLRAWMWLYVLLLAAALSLLGILTTLESLVSHPAYFDEILAEFVMILICIPLFVLASYWLVGILYTPRVLAAASASRSLWVGINRADLSSKGVTASKAYSINTFTWKKVKNIYHLDEAIYFLMGTQQINVFLIPLSAFESQEQIDEALELIGTYWHGKIRTN